MNKLHKQLFNERYHQPHPVYLHPQPVYQQPKPSEVHQLPPLLPHDPLDPNDEKNDVVIQNSQISGHLNVVDDGELLSYDQILHLVSINLCKIYSINQLISSVFQISCMWISFTIWNKDGMNG